MIIPPDEIADYVRFDPFDGYTLIDSAPDDVREWFIRWFEEINL